MSGRSATATESSTCAVSGFNITTLDASRVLVDSVAGEETRASASHATSCTSTAREWFAVSCWGRLSPKT